MNRSLRTCLLLAALSVNTGCMSLELDVLSTHWFEMSPPPAQVYATWDSRVRVAVDSVNKGAPLPGLAGRMYLFSENLDHLLVSKGKARVDLFDVTEAKDEPKHLEFWEIDHATLHRMVRKDRFGNGYTLFLPWATYRPDIKVVKLQVAFFPERGAPLYAEPNILTLQPDHAIQIREQTVPVTRDSAGHHDSTRTARR